MKQLIADDTCIGCRIDKEIADRIVTGTIA